MRTFQPLTPDTLADAVEFDSPFLVGTDGRVQTYLPDVFAPVDGDRITDDACPDGWELIDGWSGQHGYSGPTMHASEYLGGAMARSVLDNPGVYCLAIAYSNLVDIPAGETCNSCGEHDPRGLTVDNGQADGMRPWACEECDGEPAGWYLLRATDQHKATAHYRMALDIAPSVPESIRWTMVPDGYGSAVWALAHACKGAGDAPACSFGMSPEEHVPVTLAYALAMDDPDAHSIDSAARLIVNDEDPTGVASALMLSEAGREVMAWHDVLPLPDHLDTARDMGRRAGRAAAQFAVPPGVPAALRMLAAVESWGEDSDALPEPPNLSGGWADELTPLALACDVLDADGHHVEDVLGDHGVSEIAEAWEQGVDETFWDECERIANARAPRECDGSGVVIGADGYTPCSPSCEQCRDDDTEVR